MTIGEYIKRYRAENKMGSRAFADKCGISRAYVGVLERGINPSTNQPVIPSRDTVQKVADATGISFDELVALISKDGTLPFVEKANMPRFEQAKFAAKNTPQIAQDPELASDPSFEQVCDNAEEGTKSKHFPDGVVLASEYISPMMNDIEEALRLVANKYGIELRCFQESEAVTEFRLRAYPDTSARDFISMLCSLPLDIYHEEDVAWRSAYIKEGVNFQDKANWDSVCGLMGLQPDDFGREVDCGHRGTVRIIKADSTLVRTGMSNHLHVQTLDVRTGKKSLTEVATIKQYLPEYWDLPYWDIRMKDCVFEKGEWLYWVSRKDSPNLTDPVSGKRILPEDYHKVIHLDQSNYEIAGYARFGRSNPIILRSLRRKGLRRISVREALKALGRI